MRTSTEAPFTLALSSIDHIHGPIIAHILLVGLFFTDHRLGLVAHFGHWDHNKCGVSRDMHILASSRALLPPP